MGKIALLMEWLSKLKMAPYFIFRVWKDIEDGTWRWDVVGAIIVVLIMVIISIVQLINSFIQKKKRK